MESDGSLSRSQAHVTRSSPEPDESSPYPHISLISILILPSHLRLGLPSSLLSHFPTYIFYACAISPMNATFPAHVILLIWLP
jgi:hypothetical protein